MLGNDIETAWCVITETCYFLQSCRGVEAAITFINAVSEGLFEIFEIKNYDALRIRELIIQYRYLRMDLTDYSLFVLAEKCQTGRILSLISERF